MLTDDQMNAIAASQKKAHRKITSDANSADYTPAEVEFLRAIQKYKSVMHRPWPTWYEVLAILKALGWQEPAA